MQPFLLSTVFFYQTALPCSGGYHMARGREAQPRLGWMDGVKVAFGNGGVTVEAARQYAKDRKASRALVHM